MAHGQQQPKYESLNYLLYSLMDVVYGNHDDDENRLTESSGKWVFTLQSLCAILLARALLAIYIYIQTFFFFFWVIRVILYKLNYCSFEQFNCTMMVKLLFGKTVKYYSDIGEGCPRQHGIGVKVKAKTTSNVIKILKHIC